MSPGTPCYFLVDGKCSDYPNRPIEPCQSYTCAWLDDPTFPDWIKPSLANVIISKRTLVNTDIVYYEVAEAGGKIDSVVLNWVMRWAIATGTNLVYFVNRESYTIGSLEFTQNAKPI